MKEGYTPSFQIHKEGGGGLTPHGLDPYANNGEKSMNDTQNNEPQQPSLLVDKSGRQIGAPPDPFNLSDRSGERPLIDPRTHPGHEYIPDPANFKTHAELYEMAKAWAREDNKDFDSLSSEEKDRYVTVAKGGIASLGFEYTPENRDFIPPPPLANMDVPFTQEVQENRDRAKFIDPAEAHKIVDREIINNPEMSPEMIERYREMADNGMNVSVEGKKHAPVPPNDPALARLPKEAREGRERNTKIEDMNQLLEEIMTYSDNKWKRGSEMSLVKTVTTETGEVQEVVDQENFMHWVQDRIVYFHGEDPDTAINMFTQVKLEREFKDIPILEMINNQDKYFRDKYKNQYTDLANYVRLTLWQFSTYRTDEIEYRAGMGDDSGLNKIIAKQFYNNSRSKPGFDNMSVFANVLTMANKYDSSPQTEAQRDAKIKPTKKEIDTNLGNAINTAFLTYFRISDPDKLREILGEQSKYLLDPEKVREQIRSAAKEKGFVNDKGEVGDEQARRFLESADGKAVNSAGFLFTGKDPSTPEEKSKMEKNLVQFINIFNVPTKNTDITNIVNSLIRKAIAEKFELTKYGKDEMEIETGSASYAQLMAYFMARPMGAGGRNDLAANANDAIAKPMKLREYRRKMARGDRAGMAGNPYSIFMLKSVLVDYLNGSRTETLVEDDQGTVIRDSLGNPHYYTQMELMELMSSQGTNRDEVMKYATRLRPTDISQRDWAQNHMNRGFEMFHDITESNEIDWSKFTEEDTWGNLRLNRGNFEKEFKDHFLKQMRYAYSTYGQLDFSKYVRDYDPDFKNPDGSEGRWFDTPLVDTLFSKQVLNVEEFWRKDYVMKDGKRVPDPKREGKFLVKHTYKDEIDPNEIQDQKRFLWKQLAIARIAADIYAHVDFFSTDPRYKPTYYLMMLEAIESIQGDLEGDEHDFRRTKKKGHAFTHAQIQWLREAAGITNKRIFLQQAGEDVAKGIGKGFVEMLQGTLKSAFKIA